MSIIIHIISFLHSYHHTYILPSNDFHRGGTVAYNTKKSGKLLVPGDDQLHNRLLDASSTARTICDNDIEERGINIPRDISEEAKHYIRSKVISTSESALSYCREMGTDFVSV